MQGEFGSFVRSVKTLFEPRGYVPARNGTDIGPLLNAVFSAGGECKIPIDSIGPLLTQSSYRQGIDAGGNK